ncbi:Coiled-coil and C2 domain-containing protein 2A [Manis javanica]|nr:Coiled-coil and C2 domain-containing protein 2A [Manis javanica]
MFDGMLTSVPLIRAGKLRAYAFSGPRRSRHLPQVPTTAELGYPELQFRGWVGLIAPARLPTETMERLRAAIRKAASAPAVQQKLSDVGLEPGAHRHRRAAARDTPDVRAQRRRREEIPDHRELTSRGNTDRQIRQITPAIGAEISGVHLGDAARDAALFADIRAALLTHRVLFFRDQDITRAEHVAFASASAHWRTIPWQGGDRAPGLVRIYRNDDPHSYENTWHCDGLWRPNPAMGAVLRCRQSARRSATPSGSTWSRPPRGAAREHQAQHRRPARQGRHRAHLRRRDGARGARAAGQRAPPVEHPVVRTHPEDRRRSCCSAGAGFNTPPSTTARPRTCATA